MWFRVEATEIVTRGLTVYVEAESEDDARVKVRDGDYDDKFASAGDDHETCSVDVDSVEEADDDMSQCVECGAWHVLFEDFGNGCDCCEKEDNAKSREERLRDREGGT
jgi:hypothetical protein